MEKHTFKNFPSGYYLCKARRFAIVLKEGKHFLALFEKELFNEMKTFLWKKI